MINFEFLYKHKKIFPYILLFGVFGLSIGIIFYNTSGTILEMSSCSKNIASVNKSLSFEDNGNNLELEEKEKVEIEESEIVDGVIIIRNLDKEMIETKIEQGKEYLLKTIDQEKNGAHKYYYALDDSLENRLHTIYTSSLIYALLNFYEKEKSDYLLNQILASGEFILSMQNKEESSKAYGAFYYSLYLNNDTKEEKFVVGTASKTIFTLLRLYELTGDNRYLESAQLGADWLMTMQNPDGSIKSYIKREDGKWLHSSKQSLLYNGQVLSALSKTYLATGVKEYYDSAAKIAKNFVQKYEDAGRQYIVGEYRAKNPISNSWVVMSLLDFYNASQQDYYKEIIFDLSSQIIANQIKNPKDLLNYGRIGGAYSTSGNGWICEVMADTHKLCLKENRQDCAKYKEAVVDIIRWLIQYTYVKDNSFCLENPERALGGIFWDKETKYIRTDSVCHGLNGYMGIIDYLEDDFLLLIPNAD
jgi:hypothetical protein